MPWAAPVQPQQPATWLPGPADERLRCAMQPLLLLCFAYASVTRTEPWPFTCVPMFSHLRDESWSSFCLTTPQAKLFAQERLRSTGGGAGWGDLAIVFVPLEPLRLGTSAGPQPQLVRACLNEPRLRLNEPRLRPVCRSTPRRFGSHPFAPIVLRQGVGEPPRPADRRRPALCSTHDPRGRRHRQRPPYRRPAAEQQPRISRRTPT